MGRWRFGVEFDDAARETWRLRVRASIIDVNDGVVSAAGVAEGFAAAGASMSTLLLAGLAVALAGGFSAAGGRYTEERTLWEIHTAAIQQKRASLEADPEGELDELIAIYEAKGLTPELARQVARELMHRDPVAAHVDAELHLADLGPSSGALAAGVTAGLSFVAGATLPMLAMQLLPLSERMVLTFIAVLLGLALTGWFASWLTKLPAWRLIRRNVTIGLTAMLLSLLVAALIAPAR